MPTLVGYFYIIIPQWSSDMFESWQHHYSGVAGRMEVKLGWDEPLPEDLRDRWLHFREALPQLSEIRISRWLGTSSRTEWHLHGFADASKRAYAAVVYAVIPSVSSRILMVKTQVAPVKVESIPRLELYGAVLLARLTKHLVDNLLQLPASTNFWSDSKVVLDWLKSHPSRWPTFIANRVSEQSGAMYPLWTTRLIVLLSGLLLKSLLVWIYGRKARSGSRSPR